MQNSSYLSVNFDDLPGWRLKQISKIGPTLYFSAPIVLNEPLLSKWHPFYQAVLNLKPSSYTDEKTLRHIIQAYLVPHKPICNTLMHFTGYYEPLLKGSLTPSDIYNTPLYALPSEEEVNFKIPRSDIVKGALANKGLELVWVDDPIAAFFLQIQGSGRIVLENEEILYLGYAGTNRHAYYPIGKTLIEKKVLPVEEVNLQSITQWLKDNPAHSEALMSENQSYVFFKILSDEGAIGTQGSPLTAGNSLAVDPLYISLGSLIWVNIPHPLNMEEKLQHCMVAQDTGGAIKGAFRGDYFWGFGENAEQCAGRMNVHGEAFVFLPSA
jgi:membrane-bound lytic murein transglycosylase A